MLQYNIQYTIYYTDEFWILREKDREISFHFRCLPSDSLCHKVSLSAWVSHHEKSFRTCHQNIIHTRSAQTSPNMTSYHWPLSMMTPIKFSRIPWWWKSQVLQTITVSRTHADEACYSELDLDPEKQTYTHTRSSLIRQSSVANWLPLWSQQMLIWSSSAAGFNVLAVFLWELLYLRVGERDWSDSTEGQVWMSSRWKRGSWGIEGWMDVRDRWRGCTFRWREDSCFCFQT